VLFIFDDLPAEDWSHLPTPNPIKPTFATVRLRTLGTKEGSSEIAMLMVVTSATSKPQKCCHQLNDAEQILKIRTAVHSRAIRRRGASRSVVPTTFMLLVLVVQSVACCWIFYLIASRNQL
jgi:hypothetical protein